MRIREKGGLSYDVRSWIDWNPHEPGSRWNASAIFAPANKAAVETALREEIDRALKLGFSDKEVAEGKSALLSFRRLALAQDARLAGTLTQQLELGETMAWHARVDAAIRALTPAQVNAALRTYIRPQAFSIALAGDFR